MGLILLLCLGGFAYGEPLRRDSIQQLCLKADLIARGTHLGNGKVHLDQVFYGAPDPLKGRHSIEVPSIPNHSKVLAWSHDPPIATERVILFLRHNKNGTLEPIDLFQHGSQGLFWYDYDERACYGYEQLMNPGPYLLSRKSRDIADPAAMWKAIDLGLALRKKWEAVQSIQDKRAKADAIAAYLLPHTAPPGYEMGTLELRQELAQLGPAAVGALVGVLKAALPDENLNTTVLALYDIGGARNGAADISAAVPALRKLLQRSGPTASYYVLCALTAAADPRAIPQVRPFLQDKSSQMRGQAARALAAMKDAESFAAIAGLLQDSHDPNERTASTLELAKALFQLDPARARPLIEQAERREGNAGLHSFIAGWSD
jgi:hypothetical protein